MTYVKLEVIISGSCGNHIKSTVFTRSLKVFAMLLYTYIKMFVNTPPLKTKRHFQDRQYQSGQNLPPPPINESIVIFNFFSFYARKITTIAWIL